MALTKNPCLATFWWFCDAGSQIVFCAFDLCRYVPVCLVHPFSFILSQVSHLPKILNVWKGCLLHDLAEITRFCIEVMTFDDGLLQVLSESTSTAMVDPTLHAPPPPHTHTHMHAHCTHTHTHTHTHTYIHVRVIVINRGRAVDGVCFYHRHFCGIRF